MSSLCNASFPADTDIGGPGVIIGFAAPAFLTIFVAACNVSFYSFGPWIQIRFKTPQGRLERWKNVTDLMLYSLCDLQLVTATAILVAGFSQLQTITFYHRSLVMNYWYMTLNSFWAACTSRYRLWEKREETRWEARRSTIRNAAIIVTVTLAIVFDSLQVIAWMRDWDSDTSGMCYRNHDLSADGSEWLWISGMCFLVVILCMESTARGMKFMRNVEKKLEEGYIDLWNKCDAQIAKVQGGNPKLQGKSAPHSPGKALSAVLEVCKLLVFAVLLAVYWCFVQFLAVWAIGEGNQPIAVLSYTVFALWSFLDVVDLKISNKTLLQGPEYSFGFGQVLPIILLFLLGFNFFDALKGVSEEKEEERKPDPKPPERVDTLEVISRN